MFKSLLLHPLNGAKASFNLTVGLLVMAGILGLSPYATAQSSMVARYTGFTNGAIVFTGNTLGLNKTSGTNAPGTLGSSGGFISLDTNSIGGGYSKGTTLNWTNNGSWNLLNLPANAQILHASLIWAASAQISSDTTAYGDVLDSITNAIQFITPNGFTNFVSPDFQPILQTNALKDFNITISNILQQANGAAAEQDFTINVGMPSGVLTDTYNMLTVADRLVVWYGPPTNGVLLYDTGYVSFTNTLIIPFGPTNNAFYNYITVVMNPGGNPAPSTAWTNKVSIMASNTVTATEYTAVADVTALVQTGQSGRYSVGGVPATILAADDFINSAGWTLAVVYVEPGAPLRSLSLVAGNVLSGSTILVTNLISPTVGPVNAKISVSSISGDPQLTGDQLLLGNNTNTMTALSGPNNRSTNFFCSQINLPNGLINTNGSFGLSNSVPPTSLYSGREGWDITAVTNTGAISNNATSLVLKSVTTQDGYALNALGIQIDNAPTDLQITQIAPPTVLASFAYTDTIIVTNLGLNTASNALINFKIPAGASLLTADNGTWSDGRVDSVYPILQGNTNLQWTIDALPPGIGVQVQLSLSSIIPGNLTNTAFVYSTSYPDLNPADNTNSIITTVLPFTSLSFNKTGPVEFHTGNLSYSLSVTNHGPLTATNVVVSDDLQTGLNYVSSSYPALVNGSSVSWLIPTLASGASANITLTVSPTSFGIYSNTASINSSYITFDVSNSPVVFTSVTNHAPVAGDYAVALTKGQPIQLVPLPFCSDVDGDSLSVIGATTLLGSISQLTGTSFYYTPQNGQPQTNIIAYTITDGYGGNSIGHVSVFSTNRPPVAVNLTNFVNVNNITAVDVLSHDSDPDGDSLSLVAISPVGGNLANFTAQVAGNLVSCAVSNNLITTKSFSYTIQDVYGAQATATLTLISTNQPIAAQDRTYTGAINQLAIFDPVAGNVNPNNAPLLLTAFTVTNGTASNTGNNISLLPATNFVGVVNMSYSIQDMFNATATGHIFITITSSPPVISALSASTMRNQAVALPVLEAVADPHNLPVSLKACSSLSGTASLAGTNVLFTPANNFLGTTIVFYTVTNIVGDTSSGSASVTVTNGLITAPTYSVSLPRYTLINVPVLSGASDPEGDVLQLTAVSSSTGTVAIAGTNLTYTTTNLGPGSATYTLIDGFGATNTGLVNFTATNRPPVAGNVSYTILVNKTSSLNVVTNGSDPDNDSLVLTNISGGNANVTGSVVAGKAVIQATNNFTGSTSFQYVISDAYAAQGTGTLSLIVTNLPLQSTNLAFTTSVNKSITFDPVSFNTDPNLVAMTLTGLTITNGTYTTNGNNVSVLPDTNFVGQVSLSYTFSDMFGAAATGQIAIAVTSSPPVTVSFNASTRRNLPISLPVLNYVTDPNNLPVFVNTAVGINGVCSIVGTNIVFTPTANYLGSAQVNYTVTNIVGNLASGVVNLTITNGVLTAPNYPLTTPRFTTNFVAVLQGASDPENDVLTIVGASTANGIVSVSGTNVIVIATNLTPTSVLYTITDGFGATNSGLINVTVTNRTPQTVPIYAYSYHNQQMTIPALTGTTDPDGDVVTLTGILTSTNGTTSTSGNNILYLPSTNFVGTNVITFGVSDPYNGTNIGTLYAIITNLPPIVTNDTYSVFENNTLIATNSVLANDFDPQNNPMYAVVTSSNLTAGASLVFNTNGTFVYTPANNFVGTDFFVYQAIDTHIGAGEQTNGTLGVVTLHVIEQADIAVYLNGPANSIAGLPVTYTLVVTNLGPGTASSIAAFFNIPSGITLISATPGSGAGYISGIYSNQVACNVPVLTSGQAAYFTMVVRANEGGHYAFNVSGGSSTFDPNPTNNNGTALNAQTTNAVTASSDIAVILSGTTNVYAGTYGHYTIMVTNAGPSTAINVGVTNWALTSTIAQQNWLITNMPPNTSQQFTFSNYVGLAAVTNEGFAFADTFDPNLANNSAGAPAGTLISQVVPAADIIVTFSSGPTNLIVSNSFVCTITVSNAGLSVASNVVPVLTFPTNLTYLSSSWVGIGSSGQVQWPPVTLTNGGSQIYTTTFQANKSGLFVLVGSATATTADLNPTNNSGISAFSRGSLLVAPYSFSSKIGKPAVNPQTGLYEETVIVTNTSPVNVPGFLAEVTGLPSSVTLYNLAGTTNGYPYVTYNSQVNSGQTATLLLEFYNPNRLNFTNGLIVLPYSQVTTNITTTNGMFGLYYHFMDTNSTPNRYVLEFNSIPGKTYTIYYSSDLISWTAAVPTITAVASYTIWYDDGPPKTISLPVSTNRFYQILQN